MAVKKNPVAANGGHDTVSVTGENLLGHCGKSMDVC